jgi:hypothetical protein
MMCHPLQKPVIGGVLVVDLECNQHSSAESCGPQYGALTEDSQGCTHAL